MVVHSSDELNSWQRGMSLGETVRCQGQQAINEGGRECGGLGGALEIVCWNKMDEVRITLHYSSQTE